MRGWLFNVRRLAICLLLAGGAVVTFLLLLGLVLIAALRRTPEFYAQALELPPATAAAAGQELQQRVEQLAETAPRRPNWELRITEQQANGWLADRLPLDFPQWLPPGVREPRLAFEDDQIRLACHYEGGEISTVLSADVRVSPGGERNEVMFQLVAARAGMLPIPLGPIHEAIAELAEQLPAEIDWDAATTPPTAEVHIPERWRGIRGRLVVETVQVQAGELTLSGRIEPDS